MQTPCFDEPSFILPLAMKKSKTNHKSFHMPPIMFASHSISFSSFLCFYFRLNEQPSVNLAFPPVGWHSTVEQPPQITTVWACEKTVVMVKQPGHLTSMKKERGAGTRV